ncbi:hypothetical protein D8M04_09295 [Oceanobacillus piezotolerans]|uniref:Uncharacterized protein n=1 Tax=Oceanobacillus piezotolerans TaxID=2448030 RepID=A0A498D6I4_9BACI|nr:hypothetical protein [Oceanobacillus piezotolerans]RLL45056.1 hypothetical protein D8M04_09295 [Oceanobacillus piezotolerans]
MANLVVNCNHWIGYHIVNKLMEEDCVVEGLVNPDMDETLIDFFGRNSNFKLYYDVSQLEYDSCIIIGKYKERNQIRAKRTFWILPEQNNRISKDIQIIPNLLFGEWMPMNEEGCYNGEQFIPFDSEEFTKNAIDIKEFAKALHDWLNTSQLPNMIAIPREKKGDIGGDYINRLFLEKNVKKNRVEEVLKHYRQYKSLYHQ